MKRIDSRSNHTIKQVASFQSKKGRKQHQQFIAEGIRTCRTLIEAGHEPIALFVTESQLPEAQKLVSEVHLVLVSDPVMEKLSAVSSPSGIVGQFTIPKAPSVLEGNGLVLAQIADPGNMGTLIRSAAAFKINNVITIEGADPWSPKVVRASAGTIGMINVFSWSFEELLGRKGTHSLLALVVSEGETMKSLGDNWLLMVGSEAHGIPEKWLTSCDKKLTIPMPGTVESLNAAVAGSLALYIAQSPAL